MHDAESVALRRYFQAADNILRIVTQSCQEQVQHINPFLSSTIWLASAVQLVRTYFAQTPTNRSLIKSRFDVLYSTYKRCVGFWDTKTALQQNLESLEVQLEAQQAESNNSNRRSSQKTTRISDEAAITNQSPADHRADQTQSDAKKVRTYLHTCLHAAKQDNSTNRSTSSKVQSNSPPQFLPDMLPATSAQIPALEQDELQGLITQGYTKQQTGMENMAMLDLMTPSQSSRNQISEPYMIPTNPLFIDPNGLVDTQQDQGSEWRNFNFPSGVHDRLAEWSTY